MTDPTPPKPPGPRAAAKGLKGILTGKPAWMWVAGVTALVGVAYIVWRNGQTADASEAGAPDDATVGPVGGAYGYEYDDSGAGGGYTTPAPTQGSYGGYDTPVAPVDPLPVDAAGEPEPAAQSQQTINVYYPGPADAPAGVDAPVAVSQSAQPPTGGGHPARNPGAHKPVPKKNTQAGNPRAGKKYVVQKKLGKVIHAYESAPGRGDFGKKPGTKVTVPKKPKPKPKPKHKHR